MINLVDAIDKHLLDERSERWARKRHYPSDVNACLRQLYYKWTVQEESNPNDAGSLLKMRMGDSIHDLIHEVLKSSGFEIENEVAGRKEVPGLKYQMGYRIDNIFKDEDGPAAIEVKSSYGRGITEINKTQKPKDDHLAQCCLYLNLEPQLVRCYLLYYARDNGYRCQFVVDYRNGELCANGKPSEVKFEKMIARLATFEEYLEKGQLPPRDFQVAIKNGEIKDKFQKDKVEYKSDWRCRYCNYRFTCWADELAWYADGDNSAVFRLGGDAA
jgi:CRISPR/Cas system-associated exonuclease Cas4 (RecB family)